jgi:fluoroacetyl-CoA thioesterase
MVEDIKPGIKHTFRHKISKSLTVPKLLPDSPEFQVMPNVLATGYMVGLIEWACIQTINPFLDWPNEQTVGTHIKISHLAATPPGLEVEIIVELVGVEGRKLVFEIEAKDNFDLIGKGVHERFIIHPEKFNKKAEQKANQLKQL